MKPPIKNLFIIFLSVTLTTAGVYFFTARAGTLNPVSTPADTSVTLEDIYCRFVGCTPTAYGVDSPGAATSTMYTLDEVFNASETFFDYSLQKNQIWDDAKNTSSSTAGTLAYAYANATDQSVEESVWASTTDATLSGALVASGVVKKDTRTGLYWTDCYSSVSGDGSCDTITNSFILNGVIDDADDSLDAEGGNAVDFCEALSLDSNGDGINETDWYLPSQKELQQAYNNGANNIIPNVSGSDYWSSTEYSGIATNAWVVNLGVGYSNDNGKSSGYYARCARR